MRHELGDEDVNPELLGEFSLWNKLRGRRRGDQVRQLAAVACRAVGDAHDPAQQILLFHGDLVRHRLDPRFFNARLSADRTNQGFGRDLHPHLLDREVFRYLPAAARMSPSGAAAFSFLLRRVRRRHPSFRGQRPRARSLPHNLFGGGFNGHRIFPDLNVRDLEFLAFYREEHRRELVGPRLRFLQLLLQSRALRLEKAGSPPFPRQLVLQAQNLTAQLCELRRRSGEDFPEPPVLVAQPVQLVASGLHGRAW